MTQQRIYSKIEIDKLEKGLGMAIYKKRKDGMNRTSSITYSRSGKTYISGNIFSDTNLLDITSEQASLIIATQHNDFRINKIVTMVEDVNDQQVTSPLAVKIISDHSIRTGEKIEYTVIDRYGRTLFNTRDAKRSIPFYTPAINILDKTKDLNIAKNNIKIRERKNIEGLLKKYAIKGIERSFTTYDSASGYGASILTNKNNIYFSGQYSSFDKRMNAHAEMSVTISAIMSGKNEKITHLGLVSTKYQDKPCELCGCCRQFFSEIMEKLDLNIIFLTFAKDNDLYKKYTINEILPNNWSPKK